MWLLSVPYRISTVLLLIWKIAAEIEAKFEVLPKRSAKGNLSEDYLDTRMKTRVWTSVYRGCVYGFCLEFCNLSDHICEA